jgi:hypothetical protein
VAETLAQVADSKHGAGIGREHWVAVARVATREAVAAQFASDHVVERHIA